MIDSVAWSGKARVGVVRARARRARAGALDEVGHQLRLPRPPRRRPGGQRVRLGERGQQVEQRDVADGVGDLRIVAGR
jgi:hypothetical protein